eukprot:9639383-Lingulodinium_polyedra.AAC.1
MDSAWSLVRQLRAAKRPAKAAGKEMWASPSKSPEERARGSCIGRGVRACKSIVEAAQLDPDT